MQHTLQLGLVLPLIISKQFVIGCTSPRHRPLGTHTMTLASQTPSTLSSVGQLDTTLLLNIDGSLWSRRLSLALVLLFLLLASFSSPIVFSLSLLSRLRLAGRCFPATSLAT